MNSDLNKRQIPITSSKTGQSRLSTPVATHHPKDKSESLSSNFVDVTIPPSEEKNLSIAVNNSLPQIIAPASEAFQTSSEPAVGITKSSKSGMRPHKAKLSIETLEQFIEYVYARKGQRATLRPKVQQSILKSLHLDEAAIARLIDLASKDALLAVPRNLLLISKEVDCFPALRGAILSFVKEVMLHHPIFAVRGIQEAVLNLPDGPSMADAISLIARYDQRDVDGNAERTSVDISALRRNAANLLATWFVCNRGVNPDELTALLLDTLWAPAASDLSDENSRLRALTEVHNTAAIGLVCKRFQQRTADARAALADAEHSIANLHLRLSQLDGELDTVKQTLETRTSELLALRTSSAEELAEERNLRTDERIHFKHKLEQLNGRLVRRIEESIEMLEVGLTALRNKTPRIEVMTERAELVVDTLRAERKSLNEEAVDD